MCAKLLVLPTKTIQPPTTAQKTCLGLNFLMRSVCVCQTSGATSKNYSVSSNSTKNLFRTILFDEKIFPDLYAIIKFIISPILCKCTGHTSNTVDI